MTRLPTPSREGWHERFKIRLLPSPPCGSKGVPLERDNHRVPAPDPWARGGWDAPCDFSSKVHNLVCLPGRGSAGGGDVGLGGGLLGWIPALLFRRGSSGGARDIELRPRTFSSEWLTLIRFAVLADRIQLQRFILSVLYPPKSGLQYKHIVNTLVFMTLAGLDCSSRHPLLCVSR